MFWICLTADGKQLVLELGYKKVYHWLVVTEHQIAAVSCISVPERKEGRHCAFHRTLSQSLYAEHVTFLTHPQNSLFNEKVVHRLCTSYFLSHKRNEI